MGFGCGGGGEGLEGVVEEALMGKKWVLGKWVLGDGVWSLRERKEEEGVEEAIGVGNVGVRFMFVFLMSDNRLHLYEKFVVVKEGFKGTWRVVCGLSFIFLGT